MTSETTPKIAPKMTPKMAPKNYHFRYQIWNKFKLIPTNFLCHSDPKWHPKWTENWPKPAPKTAPKRRQNGAKKAQNIAKITKIGAIFDPVTIKVRFWSPAN